MRFLAHSAIGALFLMCFAGVAAAQDQGVWSGAGLQVTPAGTQSQWTVSVHLDGKGGQIDYPSLGCGGTLTALKSGVYRETITYGRNCLTGGTVTIIPMGDKAAWFWTGEATADPDVNASAILFAGGEPVS
jgi:hypothetical protein